MSGSESWTVTISQQLDTVWRVQDFAEDVRKLRKLLEDMGYSVKQTSSLGTAADDIEAMVGCFEGKAEHDVSVDHRPAWRRAIGLADIAKKVLAVKDHADFQQLRPLLKLLVGQEEISLFTKTNKDNDVNNKLFELLIGTSLMRFMTNCEVEDPDSGKASKNPDFIGQWRGKRWGVACKALHSDNPRTALNRIEDGISQIKKSGVDAGLVVLNGKNLIPHDEFWPARDLAGVWHYAAHENKDVVRDAFISQFRSRMAEMLATASGDDIEDTAEAKLAAARKGREVISQMFSGSNARPWMPLVWLTVFGCKTASDGLVAPTIFRFINAFEFPEGPIDAETNDFCKLLALAVQNIEPSKENLARS